MGANVRGRRTKRAECPRLPGAVRAPRTNSAGCPHVDKNTPGVRWRRTEGGTLQHFTLLKCIYSKNYLTIYRNSAILNLYEGRWHCNEIAASNMQMWERRYFRIAKQATHKTNMRKMRTLH